MTNKNAIKQLKMLKEHLKNDMYADDVNALNTAIQALEQEPCNDALSREDVEECIELMTDINGDTVYAVRMSDIRQLPPVNPQPKTGHWISTIDGKPICSECGFISESEDGYFVSHYCPNCGARMESEE